jgi:hypothetical protein
MTSKTPSAQVILTAALVLFSLTPAGAQSKLLGEIDFPNSGAPEAQEAFRRGVLFLHNFEYRDARMEFERARQADPDFVMAYWGEAMTHNHPIWMRQDSVAAVAVLSLLGESPAARANKAPTERERSYLHAVEVLFGTVEPAVGKSKRERDHLYRRAMEKLHEKYPEDHEATTFYALSVLGTAHEGRDFAIYMKAAAVADLVWQDNKKHPGAAHYLIHSFDDPIHAPLGLPMARVYAQIAPDASHAQHMVSHIFTALGMWDDVVEANEIARDVQDARRAELGQEPNVCGHYTSWLEYGYLEQGRFEAASKTMDDCANRMDEMPTGGERAYFANMRARYVLDTEDWPSADRWQADFSSPGPGYRNYHFTTGFSASKRGDVSGARAALGKMRTSAVEGRPGSEDRITPVAAMQLEGLIAIAEEGVEKGLNLLEESVLAEEELPLEFGPPVVVKPTNELYGEVLLQHGYAARAVNAFRRQLERTPNRTTSLLGLARAATAVGDIATVNEAHVKLGSIWHRADPSIPGLEEVREQTD